ncbi:MAG: hypothetical protein ACXVEQ_19280 [Nocardioidaceae bacterium]
MRLLFVCSANICRSAFAEALGEVHMTDRLSGLRDVRFSASDRLRTLGAMSTTLLTKRRAVDHCRMRSSLCRMS